MENNLFLRPYITALNFVNEPEQKGFLRKNIITDSLPYKVKEALLRFMDELRILLFVLGVKNIRELKETPDLLVR